VLAAYEVGSSRRNDIYGLDLTLAAFSTLVRNAGQHARLDIFVAKKARRGFEQMYLQKLNEKARNLGVETAVIWHFEERLTYALKPGVVFLRPTYIDGDSVSVREALDAGCDVIASDAAERPDGCRLFATGDESDFALKLQESISRPRLRKLPQKSEYREGPTGSIIDLYRRLTCREDNLADSESRVIEKSV
jgi:glycosyltransferase involved in cell wall biosynthesis